MTSSGWVSSVAGTAFEGVADVKTDLDGNIYTIGTFNGTTDFDGSSGAQNKTTKGEFDVYVTKHNSSGELVWVSTFGGSKNDLGFGLDIHESGEVYVVGSFEQQADFDPTDGEMTLTAAGQQDIFVVKLNSAGELIWAKRIGGTSLDEANDVAIDQSGDIYVVGRFVGTVDFNPGSGTHNLSAPGGPDAYVLKLNATGDFLWAYDFGSGSNEEAEAVVVDHQNNVIITGNFSGTTDFDPGAGQASVYGDGLGDPFYLKLSPAGAFIWVTTFTSTGFVYSADIDIDANNNIVAHGFFSQDIDFDPEQNGGIMLSKGSEDSYTAKLNSNGNLMWSAILGGESIEFGYGVAVDVLGDVYVTGLFYDSPDFDPGNGEFLLPSAGLEDTYIIKYNSQGHLVWAKRTGGTSGDSGYGIDVTTTGDIVIVGSFFSTSDLDPEPAGTLNVQSKGGSDVFILQIDQVISSTHDDHQSLEDLTINPNPASDHFTINGNVDYPLAISILDGKGNQVSTPIILQKATDQVDLNALPQGTYHIVIQADQERIVRTLIKM